MSSLTFTPSATFDPTKEKDWQANLGMLDWDTTKIVFTKRSLLEFLKSTGTTVDPNFTNLSKLPRKHINDRSLRDYSRADSLGFATFGRLSSGSLADTQDPAAAAASGTQLASSMKPYYSMSRIRFFLSTGT
ncbi:hypothetical protein HWV62_17616 [Athelia sp. TMB]|nr:hypothetical protein HWV62_17616 [Athelia sp. TMB]